jgi:hypothetical protein
MYLFFALEWDFSLFDIPLEDWLWGIIGFETNCEVDLPIECRWLMYYVEYNDSIIITKCGQHVKQGVVDVR